jgi:small conductance mechanosensitive channel
MMSSSAWRRFQAIGFSVLFSLTAMSALRADGPAPAETKPALKAVTTADPAVSLEDLKLMIEPMTKAQVEVEANAWFALLHAKVAEINNAELAVRRKNKEIAALNDVKAAADKVAASASSQSEQGKAAAAKLEEAKARLAKTAGETKNTATVENTAANAAAAPPADDKAIMNKAMAEAAKTAEKTGNQSAVAGAVSEKAEAASKEADAVKDVAKAEQDAAAAKAGAAPAQAAAKAETLASKTDEAATAKADVKVQLVDYSTKLVSERTAIIDRLKAVLDFFDIEGGDTKLQRAYIDAVSGIKVEVSDIQSTVARLKAWAVADEGGMRWLRNIGLFLAYIFGSVVIARFARSLLRRSMGVAAATSNLLRNFLVDVSGKAIIFAGVLAGLSALEVNLAPLLAIIGAAGFVVAFALQGTLSNFASGLLIMINKPFDEGDLVEVGGDIKGRVEKVSIFSTEIVTEDGARKIVPNNTIWGGVIVNLSTGVTAPAHAPAEPVTG